MKPLLILLFVVLYCSCNHNTNIHRIKKVLKKGDDWVSNYDQLQINKATITFKNDRLYCSTIFNAGSNSEFFYCFDLISGRVLWVNKVRTWADYHPIVLDDVIYYTTYLGDRYAYDFIGNQKWSKQGALGFSFKSQTYNTINHNLIMSDVINGFYEFDKKTGDKISFTAPCDSCIAKITLPVFINKYMYFATYSDTIDRPGRKGIPYNSLICQDYISKNTIWVRQFKQINRLYNSGDNLYFISDDSLISINGRTGDLRWAFKLNKNLSPAKNFLYKKNNKISIYHYKFYNAKIKSGSHYFF